GSIASHCSGVNLRWIVQTLVGSYNPAGFFGGPGTSVFASDVPAPGATATITVANAAASSRTQDDRTPGKLRFIRSAPFELKSRPHLGPSVRTAYLPQHDVPHRRAPPDAQQRFGPVPDRPPRLVKGIET